MLHDFSIYNDKKIERRRNAALTKTHEVFYDSVCIIFSFEQKVNIFEQVFLSKQIVNYFS